MQFSSCEVLIELARFLTRLVGSWYTAIPNSCTGSTAKHVSTYRVQHFALLIPNIAQVDFYVHFRRTNVMYIYFEPCPAEYHRQFRRSLKSLLTVTDNDGKKFRRTIILYKLWWRKNVKLSEGSCGESLNVGYHHLSGYRSNCRNISPVKFRKFVRWKSWNKSIQDTLFSWITNSILGYPYNNLEKKTHIKGDFICLTFFLTYLVLLISCNFDLIDS